MKKLIAVAATLLLMTGCSPSPGETMTKVPEPIGTTVEDSSAPEQESPIIEEEAEPESEAEPKDETVPQVTAQLGDTVRLGDWEVTITKVYKDAWKAIKKANRFNDKPKGKYVMVDYEAKYVGDERKADVRFDLSWSFTDAAQSVVDEASVVTPLEKKDTPTEARNGGTVKGQVAFDVAPELIKGGILSVENYSAGVYADFSIG